MTGPDRAARYLRKFYPWYLERLDADRPTTEALQQSEDLETARHLIGDLRQLVPSPA